jgi:ketosteroid isomerase-like protein
VEAARGDAGLSGQTEVVRRFLDAFAAGDDETQIALMHADVELVEWPEAPDSHHVQGANEAIQIRNSWFEAWESLRFAVDEYLEAGDRVVACGKAHALGKGSTVPVDFENYTVFTLRGGKVARLEFFIEREQALTAAGIA